MPHSRRTFFKSIFGLASVETKSPSSATSPGTSAGFKIVQNSKPLAIIVTPDVPSPVVQCAARELQCYVHRATGVTLSVVEESHSNAAVFRNHLYVGPGIVPRYSGIDVDKLASNSFVRKTTADAVFLIGKDGNGKPDESVARSYAMHWNDFKIGAPPLEDTVSMGTLFAVYDWLEDQVDVKWPCQGKSEPIVPIAKVLFAGNLGEKKVIPP